ncbi:Hint domain-containing protein [Leptospira stimsonii]|uniref:Hint domain-containing protein n=1 Tax=Leptospira stimsonii TaxID=2202203 RepID=UPI0011C45A95|nr:Hint domain-containing protein [Leptospira stimsonii]
MSFNKDEGFGVYAAKNEFNKSGQLTGSKAITFNERDGVGVKLTSKDPSGANSSLGIDPHTSVAISQRGGVSVDYENANGFGGSVNVGWDGKYSGSVTQKYNAGMNARGVRSVSFDSDGNYSSSNKTSMINRGGLAGGQDDVDWQNGIALGQGSLMGAMESVSENVAANYGEMDAAKKSALVAASKKPGSKISQADLEIWDDLSEDDKEEIVQKNLSGNKSGQHETRTGVWNRLTGGVKDFIGQLSGNYADNSGEMVLDDETKQMVFKKRTCFVAGTLVHTKDGLKKIEEIQVGDEVLSWNEKTGQNSYKKVTELFVHDVELLFDVEIGEDTILQTTWNHPFWVVEKNAWVEVKDLKVGDTVRLRDGSRESITGLRYYDVPTTKVYNFEVEENHTYFVGEDGILVHNYTFQIGIGGGVATFLGVSYEKGIAVSISKENGIQVGTYTVKPTNNGTVIPGGHSDAGASGSLNFTFSKNKSLSDLEGDAVTTGMTVDAGPATVPFPSPQIGGSATIPIGSSAYPSFTFTLGGSYSISPIDQFITPNNTTINRTSGTIKNQQGVCGANMSCTQNKTSCGVSMSCNPKINPGSF